MKMRDLKMRPIAIDVARSVVCLSLCQSVGQTESRANTDKPIDQPVGRGFVCGTSGNRGPTMRLCLRNCHRSENARMAPEPHLHAVEAVRLHSNQKCLKRRRRTRRSKSWRSRYPRRQRCRQDQTHQQCC